jgi:hypothetical protein
MPGINLVLLSFPESNTQYRKPTNNFEEDKSETLSVCFTAIVAIHASGYGECRHYQQRVHQLHNQ